MESNGGSLNGSTHPDYTDYFEVLPSNKLAVGLWLEADRMRALAINKDNLDNQKEAVKQERRLSFDNQPYATAIVDRWPEISFRNWQNSHSLIGSFEDLNASTVEDVARFFQSHYVPNNAVLVLCRRHPDPRGEEAGGRHISATCRRKPLPTVPDMTEPPQTAAAHRGLQGQAGPRSRGTSSAIPAPAGARPTTTRWSCSTFCSPAATARASSRTW